MRVLICGSRNYDNQAAMRDRIYSLPQCEVIHGGAPGADTDGGIWAERAGFEVRVMRPKWKENGVFNRGAGFERNTRMLDERPDLVLAFWDGSSRGAKDTIDKARKRGIPVEVIS